MEIKSTTSFQSTRSPDIEKPAEINPIRGNALPPSLVVKEVDKTATVSITSEDLNKAIEKANSFISDKAKGLEFSVDEDTGRTIVKLIDKQTNEILRQYPSKEMIELSKDLSKLQGLLISTKI